MCTSNVRTFQTCQLNTTPGFVRSRVIQIASRTVTYWIAITSRASTTGTTIRGKLSQYRPNVVL